MTTYTATPATVKRHWYVIDASNKPLGRLASTIAHRLRGKHKAQFTPHIDTGDFIVVVNASKIYVSGKKFENKIYYHHTGYVGGIRAMTLKQLLKLHPQRVIKLAVSGMMPRGPLAKQMLKKLKVYANDWHKHIAQQPQFLDIGE